MGSRNCVCNQAHAWYDAGFTTLTMAVNLSSRQFQQQRVADLVSSVLRQAALPSELLELELTESVAMSGDEATMTYAARTASDGRENVDRRFWYGLFEPQLPEPLPDQQLEDRQFVY